ncbi:type IIL restriction-modification enzyme MmeI [Proteus mirabilis]|uniref:type IIL restriction-modification enzyme MmeI n=1 Tax=Proteus mirabilis TaxID=584 RepID=UPI00115E3EAC|nr:type IIL restriction-modification enzyme MmeI [Proteus mirabilis]MDM3718279.1 hypothetical protein [Proteus mirabilis]TRM41766.1 hypothetical protein FMM11_14895 [Proteus mirabilis]
MLCYNTFPFPKITKELKEELVASAFNILTIRETYSNLPMSKLYDPDTMPLDLLLAHQENDRIVEQCYYKKTLDSDEERLEHLFNLYNKMIEEERLND